MKPRAKPWYRSRTLWLNALVAVLLAVETQLHVVQPLLPINVYQLAAFGLPLLNAWLRVITQQPIGRDHWSRLE